MTPIQWLKILLCAAAVGVLLAHVAAYALVVTLLWLFLGR